jgi:branched-subunit amino acid transport protein
MIRDLMDLTDSLVGGLDDFKLDTEFNREDKVTDRIAKGAEICLTGRFRGVKYPFSDRAGIALKGFLVFVVLACLSALACDALNLNNEVIWQIRVAIYSAFAYTIDLLASTATFLLNNKLLTLLVGMVLLLYLLRR